MGQNGWRHASDWAKLADGIAPTVVGGSKKHGGADLGPTRAKRAWAAMGVDRLGIADHAPGRDWPHPREKAPKLTVEMVSRLQDWLPEDGWKLAGRKTAQYRQVGNAFPPPMAQAVGEAIHNALAHKAQVKDVAFLQGEEDGVYRVLREADGFFSQEVILARAGGSLDLAKLEQHIAHLTKDFDIDIRDTDSGPVYRLEEFRAFTGQADHERHAAFAASATRARIS